MGTKVAVVFLLFLFMAACASGEPKNTGIMGYDEIRSVYLWVRSAPAGGQQERAASEINKVMPSLFSDDEVVVVHAADIIRLGGCESRSALPTLRRALSRFQAPADNFDKYGLGVFVPSSGAWGGIYNAIAVIEAAGSCDIQHGDVDSR